ncbi:FAD:protein FMN transferase [Candidatus Haliotispira prima]|uniref:FAD:protein FMN transferase n=1 Tax=Candidatus Haliotispira prima TaxID=3034016 RepID=A0ABY8MJT5_9SPIO|nr:FAD:protein FMN transferase [Candidatus Haliotispira prima]
MPGHGEKNPKRDLLTRYQGLVRHASVCLLGLLLVACNSQATQGSSVRFFALDTPCSVTLQGHVPDSVFSDIEQEVLRIEALMSSYQEESEVSILNRVGQNTLSPETVALLRQALGYARRSDGLFDPTVGPLSRIWDITGSRAIKRREDELKAEGKLAPQGSLSNDLSGNGQQYQIDGAIAEQIRMQRQPPSKQNIAEALTLVSYRDVQLDSATGEVRFGKPGMKLDLGGIAKGFAADRIAAILKAVDAPAGVIDLGGNILLHGSKPNGDPWSVGVRAEGDNYLLGMFIARPKAVVTSGVYQRYYMHNGKRYHHILSTETGYPIDNGIFSVTVVTDDSTVADALSTLLFTYGAERGLEEVARRQTQGEEIEALFVTTNYHVYASRQFARLSTEQYNSLKDGSTKSKELPQEQIWLFPLQDNLHFVNL